MGLRDRVAEWVGLDDDLADYVGKARINNSIAGVVEAPRWDIAGVSVSSIDLLVIFSAIAMMVVARPVRTPLQARARASGPRPRTPRPPSMMGVNPTRTIQMTFLIGGLMAGVAAFLYMLKIETTKFDVGFLLGVKAFTAAVLGGIGNLRGALLGGLVLGVAEIWGSALLGTEWRRRGRLRPPGRHPPLPAHRPAG